jgi:alanyl aminopeptidase
VIRSSGHPLRFAVLFAFLAAACGAPSAHLASTPGSSSGASPAGASTRTDRPSAPATAPPARGDGHLPPTARPERYALSLHIDPGQPRFTGRAQIAVVLPEPTAFVVLHARDMTISRATARIGNAEFIATPTMRAAHGGTTAEELVLAFPSALPAGDAQLDIAYDGPFATDLAGLYRVEEAGRGYAYTQFEVADARRAFPCFDEPGFKTPYDVTITTPAAMRALSNAPETSHTPLDDGTVEYHFATSPPLPSYLVAFAVGDFDVVEWQKEPFALRAITTKGRGNLTGLALEAAAALAGRLGEYFAIPYPYAKLDLVAVPDFAAGAMENPGLITFRDSLLLVDSRRATIPARRSQAQVIAHELAHQWFGDLVTMKWWDDLWLNEGFADWAEAKIVDLWRPSFGATIEQVAGLQHVMDVDALKSARAVREPVRSRSDAEEAFDGITYDKGAAVLRMIEAWLGPDVFRRGVQRYLHENAWKNASAEDLFKALDFVSAQRIGGVASSFLDQPGVPEVLVSWTCGGGGGAGRLELRESEWRPLGAVEGTRREWTLPVCVASDTQKEKTCFTLGRDPIARDFGASCPSWVYPNADLAGYYRFVVDGPRLLALARDARALSPVDRLGLVSNAWAEVRQGTIGATVLFEMLPEFDGDTNRYVVDQIANTLQGIGAALVEDDVRKPYEQWVRARLAAHKAALGWKPGPSEDDDRTILRRTVLWAMGELANDAATLDEADEISRTWLRDPASVPPDVAAVALPLGSMKAGASRLYQLRAVVANAKTPEDRVLAIRAMGTFDDPALLRKALDLSLTEEIKLSELRYLFGSAAGHRTAQPVLYAWEKENWAKLRARMPGSFGAGMLIDMAGSTCTRAARDDARDFFVSRMQGIEATKRHLDESLEAAGLCVALREHGADEVTQLLRRK